MKDQLQIDMKVYIILVCCVLVTSAQRNNVCSQVRDYDFKWMSPNCWYNSDVDLSVPDIIVKHGYPFESYAVTTQDGYILQLFRIPYGKNSMKPENKILQPVLLQHGIVASSAPWVIYGNKSIGFILADLGYDVWLANSRGSTYGRGHAKLSLQDKRYWNFSFHEMGIYDTPKNLDTIYKITNRKDIIMIGQSMGVNIQLVYAAELPEHAARRIKFMVYLAPTAFLQTLRTPLATLFPFWADFYKSFGRSARNLGILPKEAFSPELANNVCLRTGVQVLVCELFGFSMFGIDFDNLPPEQVPVILGHYPAGASMKTVDHLIKGAISARFAKYNYGPKLNLKYYQSTIAPDYQLSKVSVPGLIMYSLGDFLATKPGSLQLFNELPKINSIFEINDTKYNHIDFFFARNVVEEIINPMIDVIDKYKVTLTL